MEERHKKLLKNPNNRNWGMIIRTTLNWLKSEGVYNFGLDVSNLLNCWWYFLKAISQNKMKIIEWKTLRGDKPTL